MYVCIYKDTTDMLLDSVTPVILRNHCHVIRCWDLSEDSQANTKNILLKSF